MKMPRHQHFLSLLITIVQSVFRIVIGLLILISFTSTFSGWLWLLIVVGLGVALPTWQFILNRYTFTANDVHLQSGIFWKKDIHIPYERIQTIQRKQSLIYQIFGLTKLSIETSGQTEDAGEAVLTGVKLWVADELEALRAQHHRPAIVPVVLLPNSNSTTVAGGQPQYTISLSNLFIYGFTALGIVPVIIGSAFFYDRISDLLPEHFTKWLLTVFTHGAWPILLAVVLLIIILATLFNLAVTINKYYGFTVTRDGYALELQRGLITHATVHFDTRKVQAVQFEQSPLRRIFHLVTVKVLLASNAADDEAEAELTMIPVIPMQNIATVMPTLLPDFDYAIPQQATSLPKSRFWYFWRIRLWWLVLLPIAGVLWFWHYQLGALLLTGLLIVWFTSLAWLANRDIRLAVMHRQLLLQQTSNFKKTWTLVKHAKVQTLAIKQSLWLINKDIAHLVVNIRTANTHRSITLRYLNLNDALRIQKWYIKETHSN